MVTMLEDWIHWFTSLEFHQIGLILLPILLIDAPRYAVGSLLMCIWDMFCDFVKVFIRFKEPEYDHCPSVCVVLAGLNEAETIGDTLESIWGTYPRMEMVIVDDGSTDGMFEVAERFAESRDNVICLRRTERGGKSSALNMALPYANAEILVCVDTDSHLGPNAIWEIVQPFKEADVAAVSGAVIARNPFVNLTTWLQSIEYLRTIFLGRMLTDRLNLLGIVSGAFGAFRTSAMKQVQGWDVGPGEDGDLVMRLRKSGYRIKFRPYAQCFTNLPVAASSLFKQRRRWDWSVVTFECRKHIDLLNPFHSSFTASNFFMVVERIVFTIFFQFAFWIYTIWLMFNLQETFLFVLALNYIAYTILEIFQYAAVMYYSLDRKRDLKIGMAIPLVPIYYLFLRTATMVAVLEEMLTRRSFRDDFVPARVRNATWHW